SLLGLWTMLLHARRQVPAEDRGRVSVARVLRAFADALDGGTGRPAAGQALDELLAGALIDPYRRRDKASRPYPRKKNERPAGAPRITAASRAQRLQAQSALHAAA